MKECLVSENVKGVMNNEHPINHMKKGFNFVRLNYNAIT